LEFVFLLVIDSSGSVVITKPKATWTATLGLVVHAAADGIALGKENKSIWQFYNVIFIKNRRSISNKSI
jgi:hypothetical protein